VCGANGTLSAEVVAFYYTPIPGSKNGGVLLLLVAKDRARFLADFAVTAKEPQW